MTAELAATDNRAMDAMLVAQLLAVDPVGLGGAVLMGRSTSATEAFTDGLGQLLPSGTLVRRIPAHIPDDRLLGGLDLVATKALGHAVVEPGLLSRVNGGLLILNSAGRAGSATAARIASAIDDRAVHLERDGVTANIPARFSLIAIDDSDGSGPGCPDRLKDRLAFWVTLDDGASLGALAMDKSEERFSEARAQLGSVATPPELIEVLVSAAAALGIASLRAPIQALRVARALTALSGRSTVTAEDAAVAARLVLAPRATRWPQPEEAPAEEDEPSEPSDPDHQDGGPDDGPMPESIDEATEMVLAATRAALPDGLLNGQASREKRTSKASGVGAGNRKRSITHGRRLGSAPGKPHGGARLNLLATIRASAPWQMFRRQERRSDSAGAVANRPFIDIRPADFRIARFEKRAEAVTVFVVDASGSTALNRLAETKGAIELLLADCYVRRDQVALIAFRKRAAELLLPPTRSLARARRVLAELAGGGATPLASGLLLARDVVSGIRSRGQTAVCLILTDGQANITSSGATGRPVAEADALLAARALKEAGSTSIIIDTAVRPRPFGALLAEAMSARYLALPNADSDSLSRVARGAHAGLQR